MRGALATKQSRISPRKDSGWLRCARNDVWIGMRSWLSPGRHQAATARPSPAAASPRRADRGCGS
ncbi:hypothetical protein BST63_18675 [Bradyrhizobium canariense]|uniref:Uncharacterized protein n=1 Tax=Bradyrhizobium canariense TaxID=255045 RepID=A0A1X3H7F8_9BRAD|nr:hypothetical protein BST65_08150 [Bradyrhizobium canariense]OSI32884.1 hypothetical protein BST66_15040 [Bradyrhizobium canariense]OSI43617.1 hypothetical protein BSZ20_15930 [Bradyrhizobium canariense]OSI52258.1 hypothetical protein BST67_11135 [Bradyrhizobium canariense]OSI54589.1 hypothetical protein BSZ15_22335 [Bradyrhizobium canariense]